MTISPKSRCRDGAYSTLQRQTFPSGWLLAREEGPPHTRRDRNAFLQRRARLKGDTPLSEPLESHSLHPLLREFRDGGGREATRRGERSGGKGAMGIL